MLVIRMQRTGRSGHAQFRVVVQDGRFSPSSGRVVAFVGSYDPHTKMAQLDKNKIEGYLKNGAQPSDRVAKLLAKEGIKLPSWFKLSAPSKGGTRNPEKRRSTRPDEPAEPEAEKPAEKPEAEDQAASPVPEEAKETEPEAESTADSDLPDAEPEQPAPTDEAQASEDNTAEPTPKAKNDDTAEGSPAEPANDQPTENQQ